jgi:hypothetical protein
MPEGTDDRNGEPAHPTKSSSTPTSSFVATRFAGPLDPALVGDPAGGLRAIRNEGASKVTLLTRD